MAPRHSLHSWRRWATILFDKKAQRKRKTQSWWLAREWSATLELMRAAFSPHTGFRKPAITRQQKNTSLCRVCSLKLFILIQTVLHLSWILTSLNFINPSALDGCSLPNYESRPDSCLYCLKWWFPPLLTKTVIWGPGKRRAKVVVGYLTSKPVIHLYTQTSTRGARPTGVDSRLRGMRAICHLGTRCNNEK